MKRLHVLGSVLFVCAATALPAAAQPTTYRDLHNGIRNYSLLALAPSSANSDDDRTTIPNEAIGIVTPIRAQRALHVGVRLNDRAYNTRPGATRVIAASDDESGFDVGSRRIAPRAFVLHRIRER